MLKNVIRHGKNFEIYTWGTFDVDMPQFVRYLSAYLDPITSKCENEARSVGDF